MDNLDKPVSTGIKVQFPGLRAGRIVGKKKQQSKTLLCAKQSVCFVLKSSDTMTFTFMNLERIIGFFKFV